MRSRLVLACLLFSGPAFADINLNENPDLKWGGGIGDAEIIGGAATAVGQYPTVVAITAGGGICTGTIVHQDWVLTAAHCIDPEVLQMSSQAAVTSSVRVYFKTIDINTTAGRANNRTASGTFPKPSFSVNALGSNDVGLIKLSAPITKTDLGADPSPINFDAAMAPVGVTVAQVGFGATAQGGGGSVGKQFHLPSRVSASCGSLFGGSDANLLCYNQTDGKGKCQGDSGGPSFAMIGGKQTLVGITSFGDQNCASFGADTRTDIEKMYILATAPQLVEQNPACVADTQCANQGVCHKGMCLAQPFTPPGLGSECVDSNACESKLCAEGPGDFKLCTMTCDKAAADSCPTGFDCVDFDGQGACWPEGIKDDSGCCDASGKGGPTALFGFLVIGLVLRRRRS